MNPIDLIEYSLCKGGDASLVEKDRWSELDAFLQEIWDARPQTEANFQWELEPEEDIDEDKGKQRYLKNENGHLKAHRFVGTVCFEDTTINIWPRVFRTQFESLKEDEEKKKDLRGVMTRNMLYWASRAEYLTLHSSDGDSSTPPGEVSNFFDAYILIFANFTRDLLARQPYWQYQSEIEEGEVLRGRLVMNQYVNDCLARGRWHRLVYEHEPFDFDNLLNRIIKRACKLAQGFCDSPTVKEKLGEILFELDEVEDVFCTARDCDRVHLNRMHTEYQIVIDNCRMILAQCQADNSGRDMKRFCFLLPMDRLFEEYLRVLAENVVDEVWQLADKSTSGIFLAKGYQPPKSDEGSNRFGLSNDLLFEPKVKNKNGVIIADAKWKSRGEKVKNGNYGVSQSDMYQMVAYAHRRSSTEVRLLYPAMGEGSENKHIATLTTTPEGRVPGSSINVQIHELKIHWLPQGADEIAHTEQGQIETIERDVCTAFKKMLNVHTR